jgi:hypothetical protein
LLLRFSHGLGDAMQFTAVLRHILALRPHTVTDVAALWGKHSAFVGVSNNVFILGHEICNHEEILEIEWSDNSERYRDTINTKTTKCLREVFGIEPKMELLKYGIQISTQSRNEARRYLSEVGDVCNRVPHRAVAIHYQGNTCQGFKNLDEIVVQTVCENLLRSGYAPIILDWDGRSSLPNNRQIFCPDATHWLWKGTGTGDAEQIAALISECSAFVGIDSGPLHVAAALTVPSIGVWTKHLPMQYIEPSPNAIHLIPNHWRLIAPCDDEVIAKNQSNWYNTVEYDTEGLAEAITLQFKNFCGLRIEG